MNHRPILFLVGVGVLLPAATLYAEVKVTSPFTDHAVLQRDMQVPIWGTAEPGEKVTVKFREQTKTATADAKGKWEVKLDPLEVGKPAKLEISGTNTIALEDILVGEVWVGSGQSNMAGNVGGYAKGDTVLAELASKSYPELRLIRGRNGKWTAADEKTIRGFSALLFSFGQRLHQELGVPVGLMQGAVGGTPSGRWLTPEMLAANKACQAIIAKAAKPENFEKRLADYQTALKKWEADAKAAKAAGKRPPRRPAEPVKAGQMPSNRGKVGDLFQAHISSFVHYGIRGVLWDQGESGTALQDLGQYEVMGALIDGWRTAWGQGDLAFLYVQKSSGGGCAWDKSNPVTRMADDFTKLPASPPKTNDGLYRETHIKIRTYPNTAMVSASDLGSGVHPRNKSGYGQRAARVALGLAYDKDVEIYGPVYQSHSIQGDRVIVKFAHVGKGLAFQHGEKLQGFALAGKDRAFHWADAEIEGDTVVLSSPNVKEPVAVRYGWSRKRTWANLFNKDGLPALTFRTDGW